MPHTIADRLKQNIPEIMNQWVIRADIEVKAAKQLENLALKNSLPEYLSQLSDALSHTINRSAARRISDKKESTRIGKKHGSDRAGSMNYTMDQLILEYHILRQVICDVLEKDAPLDTNEREVIVCSIEQAVNDAATQYSETLRELHEKLSHTLAHDLRTPLTSARIAAQLVLRKPEETAMHVEKAKDIIHSIDRVDKMVRDLLDASRLKAGEQPPMVFKECDLNSLVHAIGSEMNLIYNDRFILKSDAECLGFWDEDALRRVIENLASNAIKYGLADTPITLTVTQNETHAIVRIHNEGEAIPYEDQQSLFQHFSRSKSAGEKVGWGVGLSVVKGMIEAHNGIIDVISEEGDGTYFEFTIPKNPAVVARVDLARSADHSKL